MNCDRVFELLVGGDPGSPPGGGSLAASEQRALAVHLMRCPQCRQLEQELAPALELFQAALDEERCAPHDTLPEWQALPDWQAQVDGLHPVEQAEPARNQPWLDNAAQVQRPVRRDSQRPLTRDFNISPPLPWWRVAAALLLGFVLAGIAQNQQQAPPTSAEDLLVRANIGTPGDVVSLAGRLPIAPLPDCVSQAALGLGASRVCCTMCHHAEGAAAARPAAKAPVASTLLASCIVCHTR